MTCIELPVRTPARFPLQFAPRAPRRRPGINAFFAHQVLTGLSRPQRAIPWRWLYDRRGCELFDESTRADAFYPTRIEATVVQRCVEQVAAMVGPAATLVGLGRGSARPAPRLLGALDAPNAYVPVDIAAAEVADSDTALRVALPRLPIHSIVGHLGDPATLAPLRRSAGALQRAARSARPWGRRLGFLPDSTIGNFGPDAAVTLLERVGETLGKDSMLMVGVDSTHDPAVLIPAYDDPASATQKFHRNLLVRINRELEGGFNPLAFEHEARFNAERQRVEMHLVSTTSQTFEVIGRHFSIRAGDSIHTQNAYKYAPDRFQVLAARAGWSPIRVWADAGSRVGVHLLQRRQVVG